MNTDRCWSRFLLMQCRPSSDFAAMDLLTTYTFRFLICSAVYDSSHWTIPQTDIQTSSGYLDLRPIQLGVEVRNINLSEPVSDDVINEIRKAVHIHRLLLFKNQSAVSPDRHFEISTWFGETDLSFPTHRKSPRPGVIRMSNDNKEGYVGVGASGWHIDGTIQEMPNSFSLYQMIVVPTAGGTGKYGRNMVKS